MFGIGYRCVATHRTKKAGFSRKRAQTGEAMTVMRRHWGKRHFEEEAGNVLLARIFSGGAEPHWEYDDFGTLLTTVDMEAYLQAIRDLHRAYAENHVGKLSDILAKFWKG